MMTLIIFFGNKLVKGAEIISSKDANPRISTKFTSEGLAELTQLAHTARSLPVFGSDKSGHYLSEWLDYYDFENITLTPPTRSFEDSLTLEVGSRNVELIEIRSAHSVSDVMVYIGDRTRYAIPPDQNGEISYIFCMNRNKRSIAMDLKKPESIKALKRIVLDCDVVMENFRPGVMDRLGLGYEALTKLKPDLIYTSMSAFGKSGPYKIRTDHPGHDRSD